MWKRSTVKPYKKSELVLSPSCHVQESFKSDSPPYLIHPKKLPISQKTQFWLKTWLDSFKLTCDQRCIPRFPSPEAYEAFDKEGLELWKELRKELAPTYDVFYYSTRLEGIFKHPDASMVKRIRLGVDYGCWATWYVDDVGCFDPVKLPISQETLARLNKWQAIFDETLNSEDPLNSRFPDEQAEERWHREGIRLWVQLQKELEPDYEVLRRIDHEGEKQLMKLGDWMEAYQVSNQDDINHASQQLL